MFKKIRNFMTIVLALMMLCVTPLTAYAEEVTVDYIFEPDTGEVAYWESESNGWHMSAYHETENDRNIILFESPSYFRTHFMVVEDDKISSTENGGLICEGDVYDASDLSSFGYYKVVWYTYDTSDFPEVYLLSGDCYMTNPETMAMDDYVYTGMVTIN